MSEQKKKPKTFQAGGKEFPEKPGVIDYVKEAFEPTATRAEIDAIRKRKERYGS